MTLNVSAKAVDPSSAHRIPLAYNQERFWLLTKYDPTVPMLHIGTLLHWRGDLDCDVLSQSLDLAMGRHSGLRASFQEGSDGRPYQLVHDGARIAIERRELESLATGNVEEIIRTSLDTPFDLRRFPLVRALVLSEPSGDRHIVVINIHHTICDDWGRRIFIREVLETYDALAQRKPIPSRESAPKYADFVKWENDWLRGPQFQRGLEYWKNELRDFPLNPVLPTQKPRPRIQEWLNATKYFEIDETLFARIQKVGRSEGLTPFIIFLSAFNVLLRFYSGHHDLLVGMPVYNRERPGFSSMVGMLANVIVIRTKVADDMPFMDLVQAVGTQTLEGMEHSSVPLHLVLETVRHKIARNLAFHPVFQSTLTFLRLPNELSMSGKFGNASIDGTHVPWRGGFYDLDFILEQIGGTVKGHLNFKPGLFHGSTADKLVAGFIELLTRFVQNPQVPISEVRPSQFAES